LHFEQIKQLSIYLHLEVNSTDTYALFACLLNVKDAIEINTSTSNHSVDTAGSQFSVWL